MLRDKRQPWLVFISVRMLSLLVVRRVISCKCCFVYGFLWARLQTGGWEMVASANTHSFNPPYFSIASNTHLLFSFPPHSTLSKISSLLLTQWIHQRKQPFTIVNSRQLSTELTLLGLLIFSLSLCLFSPPLSFFMHITTLSLWSLSVARGQHF